MPPFKYICACRRQYLLIRLRIDWYIAGCSHLRCLRKCLYQNLWLCWFILYWLSDNVWFTHYFIYMQLWPFNLFLKAGAHMCACVCVHTHTLGLALVASPNWSLPGPFSWHSLFQCKWKNGITVHHIQRWFEDVLGNGKALHLGILFGKDLIAVQVLGIRVHTDKCICEPLPKRIKQYCSK